MVNRGIGNCTEENRRRWAPSPWPHRLLVRFLPSTACYLGLLAFGLEPSAYSLAQQPVASTPPSAPGIGRENEEEAALPGDWAPELLDAILTSPNAQASDALYRAAFAAGPAITPQLKAALKDDRTAEFAAQTLAFIGGDEAFGVLRTLETDPRDLSLNRFYYGALAERDTPEARRVLLDVIERSDAEPDRTVSEAALLALSVRSETGLAPRLRQLGKKLQDVVIRDDLENTIDVVESHARYLASPEGKRAGSSVESAARAYFAPALAPPPGLAASSTRPAANATLPVKLDVRDVVLSPDHSRALARVVFEDPEAIAQWNLVLQKKDETWRVASVWLNSEAEKPQPQPGTKPQYQGLKSSHPRAGPRPVPGPTAPPHP